jgi:hypothetical protein
MINSAEVGAAIRAIFLHVKKVSARRCVPKRDASKIVWNVGIKSPLAYIIQPIIRLLNESRLPFLVSPSYNPPKRRSTN